MPLQVFIDSSSSRPVISGAIKVKSNYLSTNELLDTTNPLGIDSVNAIKVHFAPSSSRILTNDEVNTYLSSSSLLHSMDGWVYLSHAIESLLKGDSGIAIHLAYYAELRATMSFLATEGVGVFSHQHFCLNNSNGIIKNPQVIINGKSISSGTHQFTWDAIEKWTSSTVKPSSSELLKIFSVYGKNFEEWALAFPYSASGNGIQIIKKWLKNWNFDVNFFKDDRDMRNQVSYRPQRLTNSGNPFSLNSTISNLGSFWKLLEPNQSNRFQLLDKYLLRMFLQELYNSLSVNVQSSNTLEDLIIDTINNLGLNHDQSLINFLKDINPITNRLFVDARNNAMDPASRSLNAFSVIARATLMLRLSTGNVSLIYKTAGITKSELDFLWEEIGVENGFWEVGNVPHDLDQLWDDIKDYIDDTVTLAELYDPNLNLYKIYNEKDISLPYNYFKQFHRAGLWGLYI